RCGWRARSASPRRRPRRWFPKGTARGRRIGCCDGRHWRARATGGPGRPAQAGSLRPLVVPPYCGKGNRPGAWESSGFQDRQSCFRCVKLCYFIKTAAGSGVFCQSELNLDGAAEHLPEQNMHLLNAGGGGGRDDQQMVAEALEVAAVLAAEAGGDELEGPRLPQTGQHVRALA